MIPSRIANKRLLIIFQLYARYWGIHNYTAVARVDGCHVKS